MAKFLTETELCIITRRSPLCICSLQTYGVAK